MPGKQETANLSRFNVQDFISSQKQNLPPEKAAVLSTLENNLNNGDPAAQKIKASEALASFWKDSLSSFEPYAFYKSIAAKLDNSEKSLTFAAQIFLDNLRGETDEQKLKWKTGEAIELFERGIKVNPDNDDLRIGLGSCYIYGRGKSGDPEATMKGIQEILSVVRKDSANMKAQMMLGVGGLVSGQYDKALERFKKVVAVEPGNLEAVAYMADAYAAKGNKTEAVKWYTISKRMVNNPHYSQEVDERIKALK